MPAVCTVFSFTVKQHMSCIVFVVQEALFRLAAGTLCFVMVMSRLYLV